MLLEIRNLVVHYGGLQALQGVSLEGAEGETTCVVGSNGSGKSTLLLTISGLKTPTLGEIWFDGRRIDRLPPHAITKLGIAHVPEGRRIFPRLNVLENLEIGAYSRQSRVDVQRDLGRIFEYFPILLERKKQMGRSLSGGEQQMLALARGLMVKPRLLLLDEPSVGLAPIVVRLIGQIIRQIGKEGISIILVEQNTKLAFETSQKGYVFQQGRAVLFGHTSELIKNDLVQKLYFGIRMPYTGARTD